MKFTSEDLMKAMGLKVGDRVRCNELVGTVFEVIKMDNGSIALDGLQAEWHSIHELIDKDIEIIPRPKRIGDLKCKDFKVCNKCPFKAFRILDACIGNEDQTLYEKLEFFDIKFDQEIYDILEARLNKEIEE